MWAVRRHHCRQQQFPQIRYMCDKCVRRRHVTAQRRAMMPVTACVVRGALCALCAPCLPSALTALQLGPALARLHVPLISPVCRTSARNAEPGGATRRRHHPIGLPCRRCNTERREARVPASGAQARAHPMSVNLPVWSSHCMRRHATMAVQRHRTRQRASADKGGSLGLQLSSAE